MKGPVTLDIFNERQRTFDSSWKGDFVRMSEKSST